MRYPQEITLEVRNDEPDKKRRLTPRPVLLESLNRPEVFRCIASVLWHMTGSFTFRNIKMKFMLVVLSVLTAIATLSVAPVSAADAERPNILYCLADDWSWPHAGVYGDATIKTPNFDRVAREGVLFNYCFSSAPSCTPSRAAMLTGQYPHRLREGSHLWGFLPKEFPVYPDLLEASGYYIGLGGKGWAPGDFTAGGYSRNPAGKGFKSFEAFYKTIPDGKPFCFWFGSHQPHRPYKKDEGINSGMSAEHVVVPPMWPDTPEVRNDILDYYYESQGFDHDVGAILDLLQKAGKLDNTLVVVTGDNGWPFPRCKANLYDGGTRQPLAVRWPAKVKGGRTLDDFINLADLAPTFLEAAGLKPPAIMTASSFLGLLTGTEKPGERNTVFVERERHANVRKGDLSYPARAIRTREFLYIRNFRPDRWPAGDPEKYVAVGPFGDVDDGPTKQYLLAHRDLPQFELCFGMRPQEELYELKNDPAQIHNIAGKTEFAEIQKKLRARLDQWMLDTADPRATQDDDRWDKYPYFGDRPEKK